MFTLKLLFYSIIFIEVFTIIYNLIKFLVFKIYNYFFQKPYDSKYSNDFHLYILIPCYKEKKVIKNTIQFFLKLINNNSNMDFYIITTQKEKAESLSLQTTYDYILNLNIKNKKFHILNYPHVNGMMSDQLNYAINKILDSQDLPKDRVYFSIYNADSHPDSSTFIELFEKISRYHFPKVIQQYSNYFLNYESQDFIMRGFSIYQTAFEFRNGVINNNLSKLLYSHVVGHGLTIRADYITSIGGFTSKFWCEDIYLTGLIHNNNEKILSLKSFDNAENPTNLKVQIVQNAVWFKTASHHFSIFKDIQKHNNLSLNGLIWLLHELRASLVWIFMPIFIIYTFIYPTILQDYKLLFIAIITYLIFIFVNYFLNLLVVNLKRFYACIKNYFSTCLAVPLTCIGPIYSLFLKEKIKTER